MSKEKVLNTFSKGMIKDIHGSIQTNNSWSHARNAKNNSLDGDTGVISNEPANFKTGVIPYTVIGFIHKSADKWYVFSTDDVNSEIGLYDDSTGEYNLIVNAPCLNFNRKYLITGGSKENFDCTWQIYWDDGNNPSRTLNVDKIPWIKYITSPPNANCITYANSNVLNCEELRIAPLLDTPCVKLSIGQDGGLLRNGAYKAFIAYLENDQKVTDYIGISNIQTLFDHNQNSGSLIVNLSNLDKSFDFFELVILSNNQQNVVAKKIGSYSTQQTTVYIDYIDQSLETVSLKNLFLRTPAYEKSDKMFVVNDYLIRQGPTEQFDFNYQPLANQIKTEWVVVEYPQDYYIKGGNNVGYLRDEVYSFFIRWVYNTGEKSKSYHIPGRSANPLGRNQNGDLINELGQTSGPNSVDGSNYMFEIYNTATTTSLSQSTFGNGVILGRGEMAYWQSTEKYPATQPEIWDSTYIENGINLGETTDTNFNLCGKNIRHHKMPTEETSPILKLYDKTKNTIRILGVEFSNIKKPKFNDGKEIPNIVGYEILRGSREGNKSILAKGVFRNMREYTIPESTLKGLYPNYPYNDLNPDIYFHTGSQLFSKRSDGCHDLQESINAFSPLSNYSKKIFTFHSPDLMFKDAYLNANEVRLYGEYFGESIGYFINSELHPKNVLIRNIGAIIAAIVGIGYAIKAMSGTRTTSVGFPSNIVFGIFDLSGGRAADALLTGGALYDAVLGTLAGSGIGIGINFSNERSDPVASAPGLIRIATSFLILRQKLAEGAQEIINTMYNFSKPNDHAYKHNSYGELFDFSKADIYNIFRTKIVDQNFIGSSFQVFNRTNKINNLFRPKTIAIGVNNELPNPRIVDKSRYVISGYLENNRIVHQDNFLKSPEIKRSKPISMQYGALKFNFQNQYGQLDNIKQTLVLTCASVKSTSLLNSIPNKKTRNKNTNKTFKSGVIFGGDVYVNRYTEKVIMPIFSDFLYGQPDEYNYDYLKRINIPYPRFWMNTEKYDTTELANEISTLGFEFTENAMPNDLFYLDRGRYTCHKGNLRNLKNNWHLDPNPKFYMKYAFMYTHVNGVLDFFTESEINLAHRDWEDKDESRYYDPYRFNDIDSLFDAKIIKKDNFFKYDFSLSASKFITNLTSFGQIQDRSYDPKVAEKCFSYYPKRLIYSLQAQDEFKKDFWKVFLANNYKDFSKITTIKPINQTGAIIFFPYKSPQLFRGVDTLQTDLNTKITIGDGGLFNQSPQNIVNSDLSNEYGSCESAKSVINTPAGLFFISQAQGKIFQFSEGLVNISDQGMKWWFNKYLPSVLIKQFPELENSVLSDNTVVGIGCQSIYDPNDDVVYFCKKDYSVKKEFDITFNSNQFYLNKTIPIKLGDPEYFDDVSFTVSYDVKYKSWISFHDWHPDLTIPSINHFLTTKTETFETPVCPPGYVYDNITKNCVLNIYESEPAIVDIDEVPVIISSINQCSCPEGYTLVYPTTSSTWSSQTGNCTDKNPPICRKVSCKCPDNNGFVIDSISGFSDDVYLAGPNGDLNYINNNPVICHYKNSDRVPAATTGTGIWRHNNRCDLYSNFYGVDYPWEIEMTNNSGQTVTTLKSLEYQLESYVYKGDLNNKCGDDKWHDLDFNFDEVIIYNSEQTSGLLRLTINPKENPFLALNYPIITQNDIKILYSKEEQKYRFNQFWDITNNRGEFDNSQQEIFITHLNGYIKDLNLNNLNYFKKENERKKFRHYSNKILLRRKKSNNRQMLLRLSEVKFNISIR